MKKVGIVTLSGNNNYGNKLQNIALQKVVEKFGFCVETIWNKDVDSKPIKLRIKNILKTLLKSLKLKKNMFLLNKKRKDKFISFSNKYIKYSDYKISSKTDNEKVASQYDYFITGSDQVWNYNDPSFSSLYFLSFSKNKNKNISYAASFGLDNIPDDKVNMYYNYLKNIGSISVREKTGKLFLDKIGYNDSLHVLDPTMLLTSEDWIEMFNIKTESTKKYILLYFLSNNDDIKNKIIDYAKKNNYEIIDIFNYRDNYYVSDPTEFLYYINNAQMIFTDSFHSCVFSILFKKNFIVFDRASSSNNITNSRINDLLEMLDLNCCKYISGMDFNTFDNVNYNNAEKKIIKLRKDGISFLKKALNVK